MCNRLDRGISVGNRLIATFVVVMLFCVGLMLPSFAADNELEWRVEPVTIVTRGGRVTFQTEIADTSPLRQQGLMFRKELGDDRAMLFDFGSTGIVTMWMRNTPLSLDMVFIRADGVIHRIEYGTVPFSETVINSGAAVAGVLEVRAGIARKAGLMPGDRVLHSMFPSE